MEKKYFVLHLLPPRPDFAHTMNEEERAIMGQHIVYWKEKMSEGKVLAFGPVLHPKGAYGLGIVSVSDDHEVARFIENDPAGKINKYEYFAMLAVVPGTE